MKKKEFSYIVNSIYYIVLTLIAVIFVFPTFWMVTTALKPTKDIFKIPPVWLPKPPHWEIFREAWHKRPFNLYLKNSLIIVTLDLVGVLFTSSLVAYSFARLRWPGRDIFFLITLCTLMLPSQVTIIPLFIIFNRLGMVNTYYPLVLPSFFGGGAFNIFLLRQYYKTLPTDLDDAARIDGCNNFQIYWQILLPLMKPALAAVAIFTFMGQWNSFLIPLIYLNDERKFTLPLGLSAFRYEFEVSWNHLMAASFLTLLPCIVIFFIAQKFFIQGITLTGLKE